MKRRLISAALAAALLCGLAAPAHMTEDGDIQPTYEEWLEAEGWFSAVYQQIYNARAFIWQHPIVTSREELTQNIRDIQAIFVEMTERPLPQFKAVAPYAEAVREEALRTLYQHIDPWLSAEEKSNSAVLLDLEPRKDVDYRRWNSHQTTWAYFANNLFDSRTGNSTDATWLEKNCDRGRALLVSIQEYASSGAPTARPEPTIEDTLPPADPTRFVDAPQIKEWVAVATLAQLGVARGGDAGAFRPNQAVTRAECARLITAILNGGKASETQLPLSPSFSDVSGHWAQSDIESCAAAGVINGRGDGTFDPDGLVSAHELAKMALTVLGYDATAYRLTGADWRGRAGELAREAGLDGGLSELFDGADSGPVTREQAARLLYNALKAVTKTAYMVYPQPVEGPTQWALRDATRDDGTPAQLYYTRFGLAALPPISAQPGEN